MRVYVTTKSGAQYTFDDFEYTWTRTHSTVDIAGSGRLSSKGTGIMRGHLVEWPAIIAGHPLTFDDVEAGVVYATKVIATRVVEE